MDPITAPVVYNLRCEKEQPTLKLNNKIIFRSLVAKYNSWSATKHSCQSDFTYTYALRYGANPSSKRRLYTITKVNVANFIFGDQARKQNPFNFSHAYSTDLVTIFIITPSYTSVCWWNPSSTDWDYKVVRNLPYVPVGLFAIVTKMTEELCF